MAEQTNFYAVQRGAPWSFRPVSDGVINWYLYNFGSNLGVAFVERPSNLWVEMPWNCIFRVKNIVFSSASWGLRPPDPPLRPPYIFTSGIFFFPCAHPCSKTIFVSNLYLLFLLTLFRKAFGLQVGARSKSRSPHREPQIRYSPFSSLMTPLKPAVLCSTFNLDGLIPAAFELVAAGWRLEDGRGEGFTDCIP